MLTREDVLGKEVFCEDEESCRAFLEELDRLGIKFESGRLATNHVFKDPVWFLIGDGTTESEHRAAQYTVFPEGELWHGSSTVLPKENHVTVEELMGVKIEAIPKEEFQKLLIVQ